MIIKLSMQIPSGMFRLLLLCATLVNVVQGYVISLVHNDKRRSAETTCSVNCAQCNDESGLCNMCNPGWYGNTLCNQPCVRCDHEGCERSEGKCYYCEAGFYGQNCGSLCPQNCNSLCDRDSGKCLEGCKIGWYGNHCHEKCNNACLSDTCYEDGGDCSFGCKNGWYGVKCNHSCSRNCIHTKCRLDGTCADGCNLGYFDPFCKQLCSKDCVNSTCKINPNSGIAECLHCQQGRFGSSCQNKCSENCVDNHCDVDGKCTSGCKRGWYLHNCSEPCHDNCEDCEQIIGSFKSCIQGQTGPNCSLNCQNCWNKVCNLFGICESCAVGWYGLSCDIPCSVNCVNKSCTDNGICILGCVPGFFSATCNQTCKENCIECERTTGNCASPSRSGELNLGPILIPVAVSTIVIVGIGIAICCWRQSRRTRRQDSKNQKPQNNEENMPLVEGGQGTSAMDKVFPPAYLQDQAHVKSDRQYKEMYKKSIDNPEDFWKEIAEDFYWQSSPTGQFLEYNFYMKNGEIFIRWMQGAKTNMSYNILDRNIKRDLGEKVAFYWEGDNPNKSCKITYSALLNRVCQFANILKKLGVKRGDVVTIYLPMMIELIVVMLACARIGAVHSIVFAGFSAKELADRIIDARCRSVITADCAWRGKKVNLDSIVESAMRNKAGNYVVVCHLGPFYEGGGEEPSAERQQGKLKIQQQGERFMQWNEWLSAASTKCEPEWVDAEYPLFIIYTSGSFGKPKGVLHTVAGYMLCVTTTFKYVFDHQPSDICWCTADIGWLTGHSYVCYGLLGNGSTGIIFEGTPLKPDPGRYWAVVDKYKVTKFYTDPTTIKSLMQFGDKFVKKYSRKSLKVLGSIGEPINRKAWLWYYNVVGNRNCAIVDTFGQTETGGFVLSPLPAATPTKPGSAAIPFFGVVPQILSEEGEPLDKNSTEEGYLVISQPWPGIIRTVFKEQEEFETAYFQRFPGYYYTGDVAWRDEDGYIWVTGRAEDRVNVADDLVSTAKVESTLIEHEAVAEAAAVSYLHDTKGECLYCFVTVKEGFVFSQILAEDLKKLVGKKIGHMDRPYFFHYASDLPKTFTGKVLRKLLKKIAVRDRDFGDTSTLANENVLESLFQLQPIEV